MIGTIEKAVGRVEAFPEWARPILYGPMLLFVLMGVRGTLFVFPVLILATIFTSSSPASDFLGLAAIIGAAFGGAILAGLAYSMLGRPLLRIPIVGAGLAGIVTIFPYMLVAWGIVRFVESERVFAPLVGAEWAMIAGLSTVFGVAIGLGFLKD